MYGSAFQEIMGRKYPLNTDELNFLLYDWSSLVMIQVMDSQFLFPTLLATCNMQFRPSFILEE